MFIRSFKSNFQFKISEGNKRYNNINKAHRQTQDKRFRQNLHRYV